MTPLGAINGSERLRGIDLISCDIPEVEDGDKQKGWKRFGYKDEKLPPLRAEVCAECQRGRRPGGGRKAPHEPHATTHSARMPSTHTEAMTACAELKSYLKFKEEHRSLEKLPPKKISEFRDVGEKSEKYREKVSQKGSTKDVQIPHFTLEPNHSHFIFADDGSLNFGTESKLRADVLSCFSVKQAAGEISGGKILQSIDDGITRMLVHKLKKGWENADIPPVDREVLRCKGVDCHRFIWADPVQTKCNVCLSNEAIKNKLQRNTSPAFEPIPRARVIALKHSVSNQFEGPIKIESNQEPNEIKKEIEKHEDALTRLRSKEHLDSFSDVYVKALILKSMLYNDFL